MPDLRFKMKIKILSSTYGIMILPSTQKLTNRQEKVQLKNVRAFFEINK